MRNELQIALTNHIKTRCDQYNDNLEKLRELYSEFDAEESNQILALETLKGLLFDFAISNDCGNKNILSARRIIGFCFLMQNCIDIIQITNNAKDNLENPIIKLLKQGEE